LRNKKITHEANQAAVLLLTERQGAWFDYAGSLAVTHYDIYQAARYIDDLLNGALANKRGNPRVFQSQVASLVFADIRRDFDAFEHFTVDLDHQREILLLSHVIVIALPGALVC